MIERVLTNLLDNAIRHNPTGTQIVVRLVAQDQRVEVGVQDSGAGITEEVRAGLFHSRLRAQASAQRERRAGPDYRAAHAATAWQRSEGDAWQAQRLGLPL